MVGLHIIRVVTFLSYLAVSNQVFRKNKFVCNTVICYCGHVFRCRYATVSLKIVYSHKLEASVCVCVCVCACVLGMSHHYGFIMVN
jgi:hypothetical protein